MKKQRLIPMAVVALGGMVLAGCSSQPEVPEPNQEELEMSSIRLTSSAAPASVPGIIAINEGYFDDEGLEVEHSVELSGGTVVQSLVGGQADVAWVAQSTALSLFASGAPIRLIAVTDTMAPGAMAVVVPSDSGVTSIEQLNDSSMLQLVPGGPCEISMRLTASADGLDYDTVEQVLVDPGSIVPTVGNNRVASACLADPWLSQAENEFQVKRIYDPFPNGGMILGGYIVTEEFAQSNPNTVAAMKRAIQRGVDTARADEELARGTFAESSGQPVAAVNTLDWPLWVEDVEQPEAVKALAADLLSAKLVDKSVDTDVYMLFGEVN